MTIAVDLGRKATNKQTNNQSDQICSYGTLRSEAMIANSHKAYFNEFFNNGNISIQSAYARHSGVQANTHSENLFCKDLATDIFVFGRARGYSERVEETWYEISYTNVTKSHLFLRGLLS